MRLDDITIGITSFLRPGFLRQTVHDLHVHFPECETIVADDSGVSYEILALPYEDTRLIKFGFDSGLGVKRNELVRRATRKYFLLGTDDFYFNCKARAGVELLYRAMENNLHIDVAGGRHNNNIFEFDLEYVPGEYLKEVKPSRLPYVDMTANYFLARTDRLLEWDETLKIGGEHALWFLRMKQAGRVVVWVPGVNIDAQYWEEHKQDADYGNYRKRCWDGHRAMKNILGIQKYISADGTET